MRVATAAIPLAVALAVAASAGAEERKPKPPPPPVTVKIKDTLDIWRNVRGGVAVGYTSLNKLQISATADGDAFGLPGFTAHAHVFTTNGESLSGSRTGDIQTASNIEALSVTRLFEAWAEQTFGQEGAGGVAVRAGLMDLNETFDSIGTAGIFINSSHGIAPDLSRSGPNGPSIFPVTAAGLQFGWTPSAALSVHAAVFDGVPGDPDHPRAFAAVHLSRRDGALLIAQADYRFATDSQASIGVWSYTAASNTYADPRRRLTAHPGVYAFAEGPVPLPGQPRAWVRAGIADDRVQAVSGYLGGGVVWTGLLTGRGQDQFGIAVAHAVIGAEARRRLDLPRAETTWEVTYSYRLNDTIHLQPDVQYIVHPALAPHLPDALAVGLRVVADLKLPSWSPDDDN
ncbi:carbohydrate porin [Phenylobacterium sp.]|uniref:carbohydrate porin n=1 Tax=Phenylobacterium sp. TaxID=1871053 RepID=UPI0025DC7626|nr:carbohydrate porin [Phenylobacterium sp.]